MSLRKIVFAVSVCIKPADMQDDPERGEEQRHTYGIREYYELRKEAIDRVFTIAKEPHGFRYTQEYGKAHTEIRAALTFAYINLK